jgi:hypothetical protein
MSIGYRASSYRLAEGVLSVPVEDEAILLSIGSGKYYGIKGAMRHLIEALRGGLPFEEMVARTCRRYDVGEEEAARDLERMLPRLLDAGIIQSASPGR